MNFILTLLKAFTHPDGSNNGWYCEQTYEYKIHCTGGGTGEYPGYGDDVPGGDTSDGGSGGSSGGSGGGDDPSGLPDTGGGFVPDMPDNEEEEEGEITFKVKRDSSFVQNDKINCTYERLMEESSIPKALIDFFGEDALFDVTFNVVEDLNCNGNTNATGCTTPLGYNNYRVDIDEGYINDPNTPTIFLAQTLVHEAIHANLYAAVIKLNNGITPTDTSFKALYEDYRQLNDWQHEYMADHYTEIMQEAIREVHPNLNDDQFLNYYDDNTLWDWDEFYEYMSYRGLDCTEGGNEYFDNTNNISLYKEGVEAYSTEQPNCY